ncbi:MAG: replication initiator protein A [Oscillospiraceae bacterium]|nr:replication initiator protein A [Oscillospiraceae bacterium]
MTSTYLTSSTRLSGYMAFPHFLLGSGLSETAMLAYALLLDRARLSMTNPQWIDEEGHVFLRYPIRELAAALRRSEMTVKTALAALEEQGLILRQHLGIGKLALWLERAIPMKSQLRTAFLSPMLVPIASVILVWRVLFHQNGTLNAWLGANTDWFHSTWSILMVLLLYLWKNVGYHTILFTAALAAIPRTYIDMANLDGAGRTRQFYTVKLPFLAPTIFFVVLMSLIASMKIFREVWLLTGSYPYESLYLLQHFMNNTFRTMDYQKLSAAALMLAVVMGALIAVLLAIERRLDRDTENE